MSTAPSDEHAALYNPVSLSLCFSFWVLVPSPDISRPGNALKGTPCSDNRSWGLPG